MKSSDPACHGLLPFRRASGPGPRARLLRLAALLLAAALFSGAAAASEGDGLLPIVFVHGQSGSAQQFETQALRFTSNGYPQHLLFAFEYDTSQSSNPLGALDAFIDEVLADTGADRVQAIGHSRGTSVWTQYLDDASFDGPDKVARYVNIDGRSPADLPGGVPTIGIWGEWNTAGSGFNRRGDTDAQIGPNPEDNYYFGSKSHTEVCTSAEAFALMYEFFTGAPPATTDVVPEPPGQVLVSGRAVIFPENIGFDGATLEVWRVDGATGQRISRRPRVVYAIDATGDFGPVRLNGRKHYEFALTRPANAAVPFDTVHHFYAEPFSRSDHFYRLQTSRPGDGIEAFIPRSEASAGLVVSRQREYWGDQGAESDELLIDGLNIATPAISPRVGVNLAVFAYDDGLDGMTDLGKGELFPFNFLTFLTAADVFVPASPDASGTVSVTDVTRGSGNASTVNVPNWPSLTNRTTVQFRDDDQQDEVFPPGDDE
jgi:pimeloyl-ACP methyl ester carboxylesterase